MFRTNAAVPLLSLIVKGNTEQALRAADAAGVPALAAANVGRETVLHAPETTETRAAVAAWFHALPHNPPFPVGSLLSWSSHYQRAGDGAAPGPLNPATETPAT